MIRRVILPPDIQKRRSGGAIVNGDDLLLKMFSSHGVGFALAKSQWDVEEEFDLLIGTVRDSSEHIRDRLKALAMLNQRAKEIAELNGLIVKGSYQIRGTSAEGHEIAATQTTSRLLTTIKEGNPFDGTGPFANRARDPIEISRFISKGDEETD